MVSSSNGTELATAYVSIVPTTVGLKTALTSQVNPIASGAGTKAGQAMGSGLSGGMLPIVKKAAAAIGGVLVAIGVAKFASQSIETFKAAAGEVVKLQRVAGGTAEEMSRFRFAAKASGVDVGVFTKGMQLLSRNLVTAKDSFKGPDELIQKLGFSFLDAHGNMLPMAKILPQLADKFASMPNGAEKTALAMKLFGRSGTEMIPFLNKGAKGIAELAAQSDKFGQTLNQGMINDFLAARKNTRDWGLAVEGLKIQIGAKLLPVVTQLTKLFTERAIPAIQDITAVFLRLTDGTASTSEKVGAIALAATPILLIFAKIVPIIGMVAKAFGALGLVSTPVGWVVLAVAAVAGGVALLWTKCEGFRNFLATLWNGIQIIGARLATFWSEQVAPIVATAWENIQKAAQDAWTAIQPVVNDLKAKFAEFLVWWNANWPQISATIAQVWREWLQPFFSWLASTGIPIMGQIVTAWINGLTTAWAFIQPWIGQAVTVIGFLWGAVKQAAGIINWNLQAMGTVFSVVFANVKTVVNTASTVAKTAFTVIGSAANTMKTVISTAIAAAGTIITGLGSKLTEIVTSISGMKTRITTAASGMFSGIYGAFKSAVNAVIGGWNNLSFKVASFDAFGKHFDGFTVSTPDINYLAEGGTVLPRRGGTLAVLGEAGKSESVVDTGLLNRRLQEMAFTQAQLSALQTSSQRVEMPRELVVIDSDRTLIGRMRVAANEVVDDLANELIYRTVS